MVCARIVAHIQQLFGVRQLDGVLPRLNQVRGCAFFFVLLCVQPRPRCIADPNPNPNQANPNPNLKPNPNLNPNPIKSNFYPIPNHQPITLHNSTAT